MDYKQFYNHYDKLNDKEIKKNGTYAEELNFVEHYPGPNKIDFLDKFVEVFKNYYLGDVLVDENIGLIVVAEEMYIDEDFLNECIKERSFGEKARDKWYRELEAYMNKN